MFNTFWYYNSGAYLGLLEVGLSQSLSYVVLITNRVGGGGEGNRTTHVSFYLQKG